MSTPAPDLTPSELAEVTRFGIHEDQEEAQKIRTEQAEALREAAESLNREFQDIPAWRQAYSEGVRTDEWMRGGVRMVMSAVDVLRVRADRIERGEL